VFLGLIAALVLLGGGVLVYFLAFNETSETNEILQAYAETDDENETSTPHETTTGNAILQPPTTSQYEYPEDDYEYDEDKPIHDFNGKNIIIATWWAQENTETANPQTASDRARWEHRLEMEERYNFQIQYVQYDGWSKENIQQKLLSGDRVHHIWALDPTWFWAFHGQNLFAPIPLEHFEDPFDFGIEWNQSVLAVTSRNGVPFGFSHGLSSGVESAGGIYFNKRVFEQAGLSRYLPFELQRENNWTWDSFTDTARAISNANVGGMGHTWALTTFSADFLSRALASNNAAFVTVNPTTGQFVNATNTPEFLATIQWVAQLREDRFAMNIIEASGNLAVLSPSMYDVFNHGYGAMLSGDRYTTSRITLDEWGFVAFPRGPHAAYHNAWVSTHIYAIPQSFTPEEVADIMTALQLWIRPLETDSPTQWMLANMANHGEPRSIEETMQLFTRNPALQTLPAHYLIPNHREALNPHFASRVWANNAPQTIITDAQPIMNAFIQSANNP